MAELRFYKKTRAAHCRFRFHKMKINLPIETCFPIMKSQFVLGIFEECLFWNCRFTHTTRRRIICLLNVMNLC